MDKTININLAGYLFRIDEAAFPLLRDWLQEVSNRLRNSPGGLETIEDIEARVAEIFQSLGGNDAIITRSNVESMISTLGNPEDFEGGEEDSEPRSYVYGRKKLYRNIDDRIIGGVCGGLGAYFNIDPVLFRIIFVIMAIFGAGLLIYPIFWIAMAPADNDARRREMYGSAFHSAMNIHGYMKTDDSGASGKYNSGYYNSSRVGSAINEIFRALGRVSYVIMRIFLIAFGITFVITGFLVIVTVLMVFVFRFPGMFNNGAGTHLLYFRDFFEYMVNPSAVPWIIFLGIVTVALPMLALIYWGVKMIFWFRAKDGIYSIAAFIIWVISATALGIIIGNEGLSFANDGTVSSELALPDKPGVINIVSGKRIDDLGGDIEFALPDDDYRVYMDQKEKKLYIGTDIQFIKIIRGDQPKVEIRKKSSARSHTEAMRKANDLIYNYNFQNDTLTLDEYVSIPGDRRWSGDFAEVILYVPENSVLHFDAHSGDLFNRHIEIISTDSDGEEQWNYDEDTEPWQLAGKYWQVTPEGLTEVTPGSVK